MAHTHVNSVFELDLSSAQFVIFFDSTHCCVFGSGMNQLSEIACLDKQVDLKSEVYL